MIVYLGTCSAPCMLVGLLARIKSAVFHFGNGRAGCHVGSSSRIALVVLLVAHIRLTSRPRGPPIMVPKFLDLTSRGPAILHMRMSSWRHSGQWMGMHFRCCDGCHSWRLCTPQLLIMNPTLLLLDRFGRIQRHCENTFAARSLIFSSTTFFPPPWTKEFRPSIFSA